MPFRNPTPEEFAHEKMRINNAFAKKNPGQVLALRMAKITHPQKMYNFYCALKGEFPGMADAALSRAYAMIGESAPVTPKRKPTRPEKFTKKVVVKKPKTEYKWKLHSEFDTKALATVRMNGIKNKIGLSKAKIGAGLKKKYAVFVAVKA